tara:strand:+ start:1148 stop:1258 length:111 start_codon:yes stop_codon:yes gene_type:complete
MIENRSLFNLLSTPQTKEIAPTGSVKKIIILFKKKA